MNRTPPLNRSAALARWAAAALLALAPSAYAKILTTKPSASSGADLPLTIGSGFEYQNDADAREIDLPFLLEYNFSEQLKLIVEPTYIDFRSNVAGGASSKGLGDLETSLEYEFIPERRYRPAVSLQTLVKWPTAHDTIIGTRKTDYALGLIASKDLVFMDVDFNALYTVVGGPPKNVLELSLAGEWHLSPWFDIEGEVVTASGGGGLVGAAGTTGVRANANSQGNQSGTELLLGMAQHFNKHLKIEEGYNLQAAQYVLAWEWSFAGD